VVEEHGLRFEVNLSDYVDTGLFLDHRPTRKRVGEEALGRRVLNLFAYTGAFTVHARAGRAAATTTVDLSNTYLDWAARNLQLNGFALDAAHRFDKADCLHWLETAPARGERYDLIVCDPPTFSNSKAMDRTFRVDQDHPWLLGQCAKLLNPGGALYFSTNFRGFELSVDKIRGLRCEDLSATSVPEDFRNRRIHRCWRMTRG
jgi:23S rRNA (cytosine1962-C5)-methyltransferase